MSSSRNTNDGNREFRKDVRPLEVEMDALQPMEVKSRPNSMMRQHPLEGFWMLTKLYIESYPKIATVVAFSLIGCIMLFLATSLQAPVTRNRVSHDYTAIDNNYNFKASQIDHWCLFVSAVQYIQQNVNSYSVTNNKVESIIQMTLHPKGNDDAYVLCRAPHSRSFIFDFLTFSGR